MTLSEAKDSISSIAVIDAEIYAGCVDGRVRVYDIRMGRTSVDVIGCKFNYIRAPEHGPDGLQPP